MYTTYSIKILIKIKNKFKEISSTYPYESEIESEYELMEIANNKVKA